MRSSVHLCIIKFKVIKHLLARKIVFADFARIKKIKCRKSLFTANKTKKRHKKLCRDSIFQTRAGVGLQFLFI
jgi:hypothetical protein